MMTTHLLPGGQLVVAHACAPWNNMNEQAVIRAAEGLALASEPGAGPCTHLGLGRLAGFAIGIAGSPPADNGVILIAEPNGLGDIAWRWPQGDEAAVMQAASLAQLTDWMTAAHQQ